MCVYTHAPRYQKILCSQDQIVFFMKLLYVYVLCMNMKRKYVKIVDKFCFPLCATYLLTPAKCSRVQDT